MKIFRIAFILEALLLLSSCGENTGPEDCSVGELLFEGECVSDFTPADHCDSVISSDDSVVGEINGFTITRGSRARCEVVLGSIVVDGFDFGYFSDGCNKTLDWIGYSANKDDEVYSIQSLVDDGEFTTADVYNLYLCDEGRMGQLWLDQSKK